jgi:hypothetical protein
MAASYFFIYRLIPKYFETKRFGKFFLFSTYTILVAVYLELMAAFSMVFWFIFGDGAPLDPSTIDIYFLIVAMLFVILFVVAVKLLKSWYERQLAMTKLTRQKLEAELKMLKTQIQPHFLFNSLNSIYALALTKSDETPEMVLKLSEILNYLLYECDADEVPLEKEAAIIQNYIDLQKIRYGSRVLVEYIRKISYAEARIAPMVLLPFVENSFKHGAGAVRKEVSIDIALVADQIGIEFEISNSISSGEVKKDNQGGVGLPNISRRLEMAYPERHRLEIINDKDKFTIFLKIDFTLDQNER